MGLARGAIKLLLKEASRRPLGGRVLTLGVQDILITQDVLETAARHFNVALRTPRELTLHRKPSLAAKGLISNDYFFEALGFTEVKACDYSPDEGADYVFDLNNGAVPDDLVEQFDVVINGGTLEHIFHVANGLRAMYEMTRQEGRIIHLSPSHNSMDHGFYLFSPTLYWDYYTANGFEINTIQIIRTTKPFDENPWEISDYVPGCLRKVSFGGLDDARYGLWVVVTKTAGATWDAVPQQWQYAEKVWKRGRMHIEADISPGKVSPKHLKRVKEIIRRIPIAYPILRYLGRVRRRKRTRGLPLKVVAKY